MGPFICLLIEKQSRPPCTYYTVRKFDNGTGLVNDMKSILLLASAPLALAWLPGIEKDIYTSKGANIFHPTTSDSKRSLPGSNKVRGVNLGSHFVFEPWISSSAWSDLGCSGENSEFDCVLKLGQDAADKAFAEHWGSWITQDDIRQMREYGLNTVRIPVGYWIKEDLVYADSEHFPRGAFQYLEDVCGWASDAGMYIIMDLHGAPGAQQPEQPFTGQVISLSIEFAVNGGREDR